MAVSTIILKNLVNCVCNFYSLFKYHQINLIFIQNIQFFSRALILCQEIKAVEHSQLLIKILVLLYTSKPNKKYQAVNVLKHLQFSLKQLSSQNKTLPRKRFYRHKSTKHNMMKIEIKTTHSSVTITPCQILFIAEIFTIQTK